MRRCLIFLVLLILWLWDGLFAQGLKRPASNVQIQELQQAKRIAAQTQEREQEQKLLEQAFEQQIDPNEYIVGPGDVFAVVIWGEIQEEFQIPVTPEGNLIVPTVGVLKVADRTLAEVKELVLEAALRKYKNKQISTHLIRMRKLRVHVTGEVANPGTYVATPVDRVSDLIYRAGGLEPFAYTQGVVVKHLSGVADTIDFSAFQVNGDLSQNPFVAGGDVILVPAVDYSRGVVKVEGKVERPGLYPLKEGESLIHFLSRHRLLDVEQGLQRVMVLRGEEQQPLIVNLTDPQSREFLLQSGDRLVLPADRYAVYVVGAVRNPGPYRYVGQFLARDYVGMAGPTEMAASLSAIKVIHVNEEKQVKGGDVKVAPGDVIVVPIRGSRRLVEYVQILSQVITMVFAYLAIRR